MKRILIVDDEPLILEGLAAALADSGAIVVTAATSADALRAAEAGACDLCFFDIDLPDGNGLALMREIKEATPSAKVIIMSGRELDAEGRRAVEEDAYAFIAKPFDLAEIKSLARQALQSPPRLLEKRGSLRRPFTGTNPLSASLLGSDGVEQCTLPVRIVDISDGGMGIQTSYPLPTGSLLKLSGMPGVVRWGKALAAGSAYHFGVEFLAA